MTDSCFARFLERLRNEYPAYVVVSFPYSSPDDKTIEHFVHVLDVPEDESTPVTWRAIDIAIELYGEVNHPFHLTTIGPETSRKYFRKEMEDARWFLVTAPLLSLVNPYLASPEPVVNKWSGVAFTAHWSLSVVTERRRASELVFAPDPGRAIRVFTSRIRAASNYALAS